MGKALARQPVGLRVVVSATLCADVMTYNVLLGRTLLPRDRLSVLLVRVGVVAVVVLVV